jgi:hypothetical protein
MMQELTCFSRLGFCKIGEFIQYSPFSANKIYKQNRKIITIYHHLCLKTNESRDPWPSGLSFTEGFGFCLT